MHRNAAGRAILRAQLMRRKIESAKLLEDRYDAPTDADPPAMPPEPAKPPPPDNAPKRERWQRFPWRKMAPTRWQARRRLQGGRVQT